MSKPRIALVTAVAARDLDEDLPPLAAALSQAGSDVQIVNWDDASVDWARFDSAVLRSTWDYTTRLPEFLAWADALAKVTRLHNPLDLIRWNTDKHYLGDLARAGVPAVPSYFIEPGEDAAAKIDQFLQHHLHVAASHEPLAAAGGAQTVRVRSAEPTLHLVQNDRKERLRVAGSGGAQIARAGRTNKSEAALHAVPGGSIDHPAPGGTSEYVVKPSVGAGSRDAQRYGHEEHEQAIAHAQRLLDAGRSVLLQPYLDRVDAQGETALIYFDGVFSHAIRKGPLLHRGHGPTRALFAAEHITPRVPGGDELRVAADALASIPFERSLLYARIDLIRDSSDKPCVLELELTEPSLFFAHSAGAAERFAQAILDSLGR
jgi:glutathione synthase/RimK-type ligase-like ATP-grasp enzyme